jgi:hypothetical protein
MSIGVNICRLFDPWQNESTHMPNDYDWEAYTQRMRLLGTQLLRSGLSLPDTLFHYTSAESCFSIIDVPFGPTGTPRLWASCALGMNDPGEIRYGIDIAHGVATKFLPGDELGRSFAAHWKHGDYAWLSFLETTCVACFCDKPDLLSQWRAYGRSGTGYCLGFRTTVLEEAAAASAFELVPIIYEQRKQTNIVQGLFEEALRTIEEDHPEPEWRVWRVASDTAVRLSLAFKHAGFEEECEWRLVSTDSQNLKFRSGRWGVVPYKELSLPRKTLVSIWQGPTLDHDLTRRTLEMYLVRRYGVNHQSEPIVAVHGSAIPLRKLDG